MLACVRTNRFPLVGEHGLDHGINSFTFNPETLEKMDLRETDPLHQPD